jgi:acyl-CoA synthetase (AMP-forming)/AMP-acid ligase II
MDFDWIHRPTSLDAHDGTLNLCFNALDRHVVHGRADEVAVRFDRITAPRTELTFARLLEEVAAFGGVLRAFGTGRGDTVVARLPIGRESLVAALASARLGAVHVIEESVDHDATVTLLGVDEAPRGVIRRSGEPAPDDLDWDVVLRAGRTDPATCAEVPMSADAFVLGGRTLTVSDVLMGEGLDWPLDALGVLFGGGMLLVSQP